MEISIDDSKLVDGDGAKNTLRAHKSDTSFEAFKGMKIDSGDFLDDIEGRTKCPECSKSRKFFCYSCYVPMPTLEPRFPKVKLSIEVAIIKHPQEVDGKSTSTHAAILAPEHVQMFTYPNLPDTTDSILIYPADDAEDAVEFMGRVKRENNGSFPFKRLIFVDSTWNQTYKICHDPKVVNLPRVKLTGIESLFWRYQRGNPITHLSTIEAIYHLCVIHQKAVVDPDYKGEVDNLLFFFKYMFYKIREIYDPKKLKSYATRPYLQEK